MDEAAGVLKQCLAGFPDGRRYASSHCFGTEYLRSTPGMEVPQGHCSRRQRSTRTRWRNVLSVFSKVLVLINCATGPHRLSDCIGDWVSKGGTSRTVRPLEGNAFMVL